MNFAGKLIEIARKVFWREIAIVHTNDVAQVVAYDRDTNMVSLQVVTKRARSTDPDNLKPIKLQQYKDVLVSQQGSGKGLLSVAPAAGSYGKLHYTSRCIAQWVQDGGIGEPRSMRMFSANDCWFEPGLYPLAVDGDNGLIEQAIETDRISLRTRSGDTQISVLHDETVEVNNASGSVVIDSSGQVVINGGGGTAIEFARLKTAFDTLKSEVNAHITAYNSHLHLGVPHATTFVGPVTVPGVPAAADMTNAESDTVEVP